MINWIPYDPDNPPKENIDLLACSSGTHVWVAQYILGKWKVDFDTLNYVTHYAHINLPGEDTPE